VVRVSVTEEPQTFTLVHADGTVLVVISRFLARRVARELNEDQPSPYLRFEVERLGFLRWAVVATAADST